jgi:hypothetical protein
MEQRTWRRRCCLEARSLETPSPSLKKEQRTAATTAAVSAAEAVITLPLLLSLLSIRVCGLAVMRTDGEMMEIWFHGHCHYYFHRGVSRCGQIQCFGVLKISFFFSLYNSLYDVLVFSMVVVRKKSRDDDRKQKRKAYVGEDFDGVEVQIL